MFIGCYAAKGQKMQVYKPNLYSFIEDKKTPSFELFSGSNKDTKHPESGILPYNAGCRDCYELIERRTQSERYFVKENSDGKKFYMQGAYGPLHYKDLNGRWITIDPRIKPDGEKRFIANHQPFPVTIDLDKGYTSLREKDDVIFFNQDAKVYYLRGHAIINEQESSNDVFYTAGDNGVEQRNFVPGIYRQFVTGKGNIETNYIIQQKPEGGPNTDFMVFEDTWTLPEGYSLIKSTNGYTTEDGIWNGALIITDAKGNEAFHIDKPLVAETKTEEVAGEEDNVTSGYRILKRGTDWVLQLMVPMKWLQADERQYPVIVDPLVSVSGAWAGGYPQGSGYSNTCWTNSGCGYTININFPGGSTVTNSAFTAEYGVGFGCGGTCRLGYGAFDVMGPCGVSLDPSTNGAWSCPYYSALLGGPSLGAVCFTVDANQFPGAISAPEMINGCLTPSCNPIIIPFTLRLMRCSICPGGTCDNSCIFLSSTQELYTITVEGETIQSKAYTLSGATSASICLGSSVDLIDSAKYGVPPYNYMWNPSGFSSMGISDNPAVSTTYTVTTTDACGNSVNATIPVTVTPLPSSTFTLAATGCPGKNVTITYTGGAPANATYNWNFGGATIISGSGQGPYVVSWGLVGTKTVTLQVTQGTCPSGTTSKDIVIDVPTSTFSFSSVGCFKGLITYTGNAPANATYTWNFNGGTAVPGTGQGPHTVTWSAASTYNVSLQVTDANGCSSATNTVPVVVTNNPPLATFTIGKACELTPTTITYTGSATSAGIYTWNFGGGIAVPGTGKGPHAVTWTTTGTKTVTLIVSEGGCTSSLYSNTIGVTALPDPSFTYTTNICAGTPSTITYTGTSSASAVYDWDFQNGNPLTATGQGPHSVTWASGGTFVIRLQVTENGCTSLVGNNTIVIKDLSTSTFTTSVDTSCSTSPVIATYTGNASAGSVFQWNFNGGTAVPGTGQGPHSITWPTGGKKTITLKLTDPNGCISPVSSRDVIIQAAPSSSFTTGSTSVCFGPSSVFTYSGGASPNAAYTWDFGGEAALPGMGQGPQTIAWSSTGAHTIRLAVSENGCNSDTTDLIVQVNAVPTSSFSMPTSICDGGLATINYSGTASAGATYNWDFNGGTALPGTGQGPQTVNWSMPGNYTITLSVTENGCSSTLTSNDILVNPIPAPSFGVSPSSICIGGNVTVTYNGAPTGTSQYNWDFNAGVPQTSTGQGPHTITYNSPGTFTIQLDQSDNGCSKKVFQQVIVNPYPISSFTVNPSTVCAGQPITLTFNGTASAGANYKWSLGSPVIVSGTPTSAGPLVLIYNNATAQTITLSITDNGCPGDTFLQEVNINPIPVADFNAPVLGGCDMLNVDFVNQSVGANQYLWNMGDNTDDTTATPSHTYYNGNYTISLIATNPFGCSDTMVKPDYLHIESTPTAFFTSYPQANIPVELKDALFSFLNQSDSATSYLWEFGDSTISTEINVSHTYADTGTYTVTLIAYNNFGCSDTFSLGPLLVIPADMVFVPTAFTPNNDGLNELFKVYGTNISETHLMVYDRWGERVYDGDGLNTGWDGKLHGLKLNTDIYVYYMEVIKTDGKLIKLKGDVTLIR